MGKLHVPRFDSAWGTMAIVESGGHFLIMDTYGFGQSHAREYTRKLLAGRKAGLLITHGHRDHNGDYAWYMDNGLISDLYVSATAPVQETHKDLDRHRAMLSKAKANGISIHYLQTGDAFKVGSADVSVLYARSSGGNNARSLCLRIDLGGCRILNCGDAEPATLNECMSRNQLGDIDIAFVNHHGVDSNNPLAWAKKIQPTILVTNCCDENSKVFPASWAKAAYSRYQKYGANVYSTQHNGDLVFTCFMGQVTPRCERNTVELCQNGRTVQFNDKAPVSWIGTFACPDLSAKELAAEVMIRKHGNADERKARLGGMYDAAMEWVNRFARSEGYEDLCWTLAGYVLKGYAGAGDARKALLNVENGGRYYDDVQALVTKTAIVANGIISGTVNYGRDPERRQRLAADGYDPQVVQQYINYLLM